MKTENLIPQPKLRRMFGGVSNMTLLRWRQKGTLPEPIVINRRNYYRESDIAEMQERLAGNPQTETTEAAEVLK